MHTLKGQFLSLVASLIIVATSEEASADLITFTNPNLFLAAAGKTSLESFESVPDRGLSSDPISTALFTLKPIGGFADVESSPSPDGEHATDGVKFVTFGYSAPLPSGTLEFDLSTPATSFGLFVTDFGDINPGTLTIRTDVGEAGSGLLIAMNPPPLPNAATLFFGFVQDTTFDRVFLTITTPNDGIGIDQISLAPVPEPSSILLACVCVGALLASCVWRRIRGSASVAAG